MRKKKRLRKKIATIWKKGSTKRRLLVARGASAIPHIFTLGNAFFGFLSIIFASKGAYVASAYCIFMGILMDALDGRIARLLNATSPLGLELDSLCDAISFCLAPATLVYFKYLDRLGPLGVFVSACYILAGIFRLARFNLISDQQSVYFLGLPTTAAACFLISLLLNIKFNLTINHIVGLMVLMLVLALLMVSSVPFPSFKSVPKISRRFKKHTKIMIVAVFAFVTIFKFKRVILWSTLFYLISSPVLYLHRRYK